MDKKIIHNSFKVTVKSGDKEVKIEIPLGTRSEIGMDSSGTGYRALEISKKLIEQINELK